MFCVLCISINITESEYLSSLKMYIFNFDIHVTVHRDKFRIINPTRCTNFSVLFSNETLHVSDRSSVHHQEFFIVHTTMVNVTPVCGQLASRIRMFHPDPACKVSANLYDIIPLLCVQ